MQLSLPELEDRALREALLGPAEQGLGAGEVFVRDGFAQIGLPGSGHFDLMLHEQ